MGLRTEARPQAGDRGGRAAEPGAPLAADPWRSASASQARRLRALHIFLLSAISECGKPRLSHPPRARSGRGRRSFGGRPRSMTRTVRRATGPRAGGHNGCVLAGSPGAAARAHRRKPNEPGKARANNGLLRSPRPRAAASRERRRAGARFEGADQPGAAARPGGARSCRSLPSSLGGRRAAYPGPGLAPQPRTRSRRSRSLITRQVPPPNSTLRCQSSRRVMYSRGSTLSERSLVTLIAITSKPSTVSGMSRI